jgi:hypothetical protein
MRDQQEVGRREQLWSSLSEGRAPQDGEVQTIAAKIWQDAFRRDSALAWSQVEVGSPTHRKSIAAALAALGTYPKIPSRG